MKYFYNILCKFLLRAAQEKIVMNVVTILNKNVFNIFCKLWRYIVYFKFCTARFKVTTVR